MYSQEGVSFVNTSAVGHARVCWSRLVARLGGHASMSVDAHGADADNDLNADDILADGLGFRDKKSPKDQTQLEVAIGDGMEFTIHGEIGLRQKYI